MALFGVAQPGYNSPATNGLPTGLNCQAVASGDDYLMLDGTETIVTGSKSVHFSAQYAPGGGGATSFFVSGCPNGTQITIQGFNGLPRNNLTGEFLATPTVASFDATFQDLFGENLMGNGNTTDPGSCTFYRVNVASFVNGDVPVVIAKRR